jgi:hypothetical protein
LPAVDLIQEDWTARCKDKADCLYLVKQLIQESLVKKVDMHILNKFVEENLTQFASEIVLILGRRSCEVLMFLNILSLQMLHPTQVKPATQNNIMTGAQMKSL